MTGEHSVLLKDGSIRTWRVGDRVWCIVDPSPEFAALLYGPFVQPWPGVIVAIEDGDTLVVAIDESTGKLDLFRRLHVCTKGAHLSEADARLELAWQKPRMALRVVG